MNVRVSPWVTAAIIAVLLVVIYVVYMAVDSPARRVEEMEKYIAASAVTGPLPNAKKSATPAASTPKPAAAKVESPAGK